MADLTFTGLNIPCADVEKSVAFFRLLGASIPDEKVWRTKTGAHHVQITFGKDGLGIDLDSYALAGKYNAGFKPARGGSLVISLHLAARDDVDATFKRATDAGHPGVQQPYDAFWGARYAIVADPDGNHIGLMSPSDPALRSPGGPEL